MSLDLGARAGMSAKDTEMVEAISELRDKYKQYLGKCQENLWAQPGIIDRRAEAMRDVFDDIVDDLEQLLKNHGA